MTRCYPARSLGFSPLTFSPNGERLVMPLDRSAVKVVDIPEGSSFVIQRGPKVVHHCLVFSSDSHYAKAKTASQFSTSALTLSSTFHVPTLVRASHSPLTADSWSRQLSETYSCIVEANGKSAGRLGFWQPHLRVRPTGGGFPSPNGTGSCCSTYHCTAHPSYPLPSTAYLTLWPAPSNA